jgi:hypothetical protein
MKTTRATTKKKTTTTRATRNNPPARAGGFESVGAILARMFEVRGDRLERHITRARPDHEGRADGRRECGAYEQGKAT